ncbi:hypothetical protein [Bacillus sp. ISL-7]|uniref:hypothetical protein n=1 Tax=Bacillus sp. ISL-7 TaxID=2819136 RepID=UPI001BECF98C|nr:hypothetical protein [Bacillus sp. ISL-7]MBT2736567.1 hypothetical protein [Bacillus sp. ISL-7]
MLLYTRMLYHSDAGNDDFKGAEREACQDYMYFTKKAFVVENIIRSRIGFVPVRITDKYLAIYLANIEKDKKGSMVIRIQRQELKPLI